MRITYDPSANVAYVALHDDEVEVETRIISDDIVIDVRPDGTLHGIELLNANSQLSPDDGDLVVLNSATGKEVRLKLDAA